MSARRVQFIDPSTNTVLPPVTPSPSVIPISPSTPSPTFTHSESSLLPSNSPAFPPAAYRIPITPHPILASLPSYFNLALFPSISAPWLLPTYFLSSSSDNWRTGLLRNANSADPLVPPVLNLPATYPPLPFMTLMSSLLPWVIHVEASQPSPNPVVTIYDLLQTLYLQLRVAVTPREWGTVRPDLKTIMTSAFYQRINSIPDHKAREREFQRGLRRVDFLMGKTRLAWFSAVADRPGAFLIIGFGRP